MILDARKVKDAVLEKEDASPGYSLCVAGGYPPPLTGMTIATERLYDMLSEERPVGRINFAEGGRGNPRDKMTWNRLRAVHRYAKEIRKAHPDVMIYANLSGSIPGHLRDFYVFNRGVPTDTNVICWVHNGNVARHFRTLGRQWSARQIAGKVHRFVLISKLLDRRLAAFVPAEKRRVIPNTIDEVMMCSGAEVERAQEARRLRSGPIRCLYVSQMIRLKGYEVLLDAAAQLRSAGHDVSVEYAGRWMTPEDEKRFHAYVADRGMTDWVTMHGLVSDRSLLKTMMLEADMFVLPSYHPSEASPICLIEALNAGLPVVSTELGGIPDTVHHEVNGRLARPNDPDDLAHQLSFLMEKDYRIAMGERARASFRKTFAPEIVRAQWLELLAEVGASLPGRERA